MRWVVAVASGLVLVTVLAGCAPSDGAGTPGAVAGGASTSPSASPTASASSQAASTPRCKQSVAPDDRDNQGISARLCVSDATPAVGQAVVFSVKARDPDARLFGLTGCYPNDLRFGDEEMICEGGPACAAGGAMGTVKEPGRFDARRRHTYSNPGRYTARLMLRSGSQCPHPYSNGLTMTLKVTVQE